MQTDLIALLIIIHYNSHTVAHVFERCTVLLHLLNIHVMLYCLWYSLIIITNYIIIKIVLFRWLTGPAVVNAFYSASKNQICKSSLKQTNECPSCDLVHRDGMRLREEFEGNERSHNICLERYHKLCYRDNEALKMGLPLIFLKTEDWSNLRNI